MLRYYLWVIVDVYERVSEPALHWIVRVICWLYEHNSVGHKMYKYPRKVNARTGEYSGYYTWSAIKKTGKSHP